MFLINGQYKSVLFLFVLQGASVLVILPLGDAYTKKNGKEFTQLIGLHESFLLYMLVTTVFFKLLRESQLFRLTVYKEDYKVVLFVKCLWLQQSKESWCFFHKHGFDVGTWILHYTSLKKGKELEVMFQQLLLLVSSFFLYSSFSVADFSHAG